MILCFHTIHKMVNQGADPGLFSGGGAPSSGGGALPSGGGALPSKHELFTDDILEKYLRIQRREILSGGSAHPLHPSPLDSSLSTCLNTLISLLLLLRMNSP